MFSDRVLRRNFSYLFVLQLANYVIPLLVFPYLALTLGTENFGRIMFAQAFVAYFVLFVDFGFNVTATKDVVDNRENFNDLSNTFWSVFLAKGFLVVISFILYITIVFSVNRFKADYVLYAIGFINVLSNFLFPIWLFQGLEKMGIITFINTLPRILMIVAIFYFVKTPSDYKLALLIQMLAPMVSALISLVIAFRLCNLGYCKPNVDKALKKISDSWLIFASSLSSNLYTTTNVVILGFLTSNATVGIFSGADKIIRALISIMSSTSQVVFPRANSYFLESKIKCLNFIKKLCYLTAIICVILAVVLYFGSNFIIAKLFKSTDYSNSAEVLKYSVLLPLFSVINGLIAVNYFVIFGYKKKLLKFVFIGTVFSLISIWPLVYFLEEIGPAICATATELLIFILFIAYYLKTDQNAS
jgi:PST family polysaccharide transporter